MRSFWARTARNRLNQIEFVREDIRSILVIRMNRIGDMINALPLIKTLREHFPSAVLTVLAESTNAEIIKYETYINQILVYQKGTGIYRNRIFNMRRILKGKQFDLTISVKGGFSSFLATASFLSGARYRIGYISAKGHPMDFLYNLPVDPIDFSMCHQVDACMHLLNCIGIKEGARSINITIPPVFSDTASAFLDANNLRSREKIVIFNISNNRDKSTWGADNFVRLGKYLNRRYGCTCVITAVASDWEKASAICSKLGAASLFYKTPQVMDFAAISSMSNLLVTGDGGASHIGAAVGTVVVTLFGDANPMTWRPYGSHHINIRQADCDVRSISVERVISDIEARGHLTDLFNSQAAGYPS